MQTEQANTNQMVEKFKPFVSAMRSEVQKVVVGQKNMVDGILMGLLTGGHVLLEGVPGLAKTLAISTVSKAVSLDFQRVQFTPDLLPSDLIGTMIFNPKTAEFSPKKGPIFSNIVLADEINRAPAKVQSALLEAMAERQVTIGDTTYKLKKPFLVLATQNPLEQEGTYPLPEAQMDRFMFKINVSYPTKSEELEIMKKMTGANISEINEIISLQNLLEATDAVTGIYVDEKIEKYIVDLIMATRNPEEYGLAQLKDLIRVGGSPRATISLIKAAKAHAFLAGQSFVSIENIKAVIYQVLRHRLILTFEAEAEEVSTDDVIKDLVATIEVKN